MKAALTTCFLIAAGIGLGGGSRAAEEFKLEEGYTSLFNGKDLTGWTYGKDKDKMDDKTATPDKRIEVRDGVILVNEGKGIMDLYTAREFNKDFHLLLEFRAAPKADSGLYIRGKQLQVRDYPTVGPYKNLKHFREVVEMAFKVPAKGAIGLQAEVGKFEFRRIRIKEMP